MIAAAQNAGRSRIARDANQYMPRTRARRSGAVLGHKKGFSQYGLLRSSRTGKPLAGRVKSEGRRTA
jgi:uncharacterized FlgJ-related protein